MEGGRGVQKYEFTLTTTPNLFFMLFRGGLELCELLLFNRYVVKHKYTVFIKLFMLFLN